MDINAHEKRLLDTAVLIATHATKIEVPQGVTTNGDYMIIRRGPLIYILFAPRKWCRQLRETLGNRAFITAVTEQGGPEPQTFSRAYVQIHAPAKGIPKLLRYYVPERIRHVFSRDRTARMRIDIASAERLDTTYGTMSNKIGRPEACADAVA